MPEWLEKELSQSLAPVAAPEALHQRVFRIPRVLPGRHVSAFFIAAAMVLLSAGTVWLSARQPVRVVPERWNAGVRAQVNDHNCVLCHSL